MHTDPEVVVIGAGPNGLVAACQLARAGLRVMVLEANDQPGGGARTEASTLPGFRHDSCSAFFPLSLVGPLSQLPLERYGLEWLHAPRPYGGAALGGRGVAVDHRLTTSEALFDAAHAGDGAGWRELYEWWAWGGPAFLSLLFHPLGHPAPLVPALPLLGAPRRMLQFAQLMAGSVRAMTERYFRGEDARLWLTGSVLHSDLAPEDAGGGGFGLMLGGLSQQIGMPVPRGGAQAITEALVRLLAAHGGTVLTGQRVERIVVREGRAVGVVSHAASPAPAGERAARTATQEIRAERAVLATVEPQALFLDLIGEGYLPTDFVRQVRRFRWGTGVFQVNLALSGLPAFRAEALNGTLVAHLGRSVADLSRGVNAARRDVLPEHPLLVAGLHTLVDATRAPEGQHTLWLMTHVPSRIGDDAADTIQARSWQEAKAPFLERVLDELEEHAPGVRGLVREAHARTPEELAAHNSNLVGGDIGSGSYTLDQQLVFRPVPGWFRYQTPVKGLYISGAATHPGGGVHGAAGANAARVLLADLRLARFSEQLGAAVGPLPRAVAALRAGRAAHRDEHLLTAGEGVGPLLQHDYWAEVQGSELTPPRVLDVARTHFPRLASQPFARFSRPEGEERLLEQGDRVQSTLLGSGTHDLEVVDLEPDSLTFQTVGDHPEAGRVTLGVTRAANGNLVVRVRSRTRANGWLNRLKYEAGGKLLQPRVWTELITRLANACGGRVVGGRVHEQTQEVTDRPADLVPLGTPTAGVEEGR